MSITVKRLPQRIEPDPRRTIARFFNPGGDPRAKCIIERVMRLPESEALQLLERIESDFGKKHRGIRNIFLEHYQAVHDLLPEASAVSEARQLLIGAYFTMEYSVEAAALFNPSMVRGAKSGRPSGREHALCHESSCYRRRARFIHRFSQGCHRQELRHLY